MNRFELGMRQGRFNERRGGLRIALNEAFKLCHAVCHTVGGRRNKHGISRAGASDPVLGPAELTGCLAFTSAAGKQDTMNFPNQSVGERKTLSQAFESMLQSGNIIRHLYDVIERRARRRFILVEQQVGERRLRPFDL